MGHKEHIDKPRRSDRLIRERVHETYKLRVKLREPTRCPQCGAVYHKGRWQWLTPAPAGAEEHLCSACQRVNDNYPAGEVTLTGSFVTNHKDEIIQLARHLESVEQREHPLNRIMGIRELPGELLITTTDVHLPRRIGRAIRQAWEGDLHIHFDKAGYFTSITWRRDE